MSLDTDVKALADSRGHSDTELSNNSANTSTGFCHPMAHGELGGDLADPHRV
jgi:hypothetical protein